MFSPNIFSLRYVTCIFLQHAVHKLDWRDVLTLGCASLAQLLCAACRCYCYRLRCTTQTGIVYSETIVYCVCIVLCEQLAILTSRGTGYLSVSVSPPDVSPSDSARERAAPAECGRWRGRRGRGGGAGAVRGGAGGARAARVCAARLYLQSVSLTIVRKMTYYCCMFQYLNM